MKNLHTPVSSASLTVPRRNIPSPPKDIAQLDHTPRSASSSPSPARAAPKEERRHRLTLPTQRYPTENPACQLTANQIASPVPSPTSSTTNEIVFAGRTQPRYLNSPGPTHQHPVFPRHSTPTERGRGGAGGAGGEERSPHIPRDIRQTSRHQRPHEPRRKIILPRQRRRGTAPPRLRRHAVVMERRRRRRRSMLDMLPGVRGDRVFPGDGPLIVVHDCPSPSPGGMF